MSIPTVSVIMSTYKESKEYLESAVLSILNQSLKSLELIVVVDNPQHEQLGFLRTLEGASSGRMLVMENKKNIGLASSLNSAVSKARGRFIARMDADDEAMPNRLQEQLKYLIHSKSDLVGCSIERVDEKGAVTSISRLPSNPTLLRWLLPFGTIAYHPTWFARAEVFKNNKYCEVLFTAQDYELLHRLIKIGYTVSNLDAPLLRYRDNPNGISAQNAFLQFKLHQLISEGATGCSLDRELNYLYAQLTTHRELVEEFGKFREDLFRKRGAGIGCAWIFERNQRALVRKSVMSYAIKKLAQI